MIWKWNSERLLIADKDLADAERALDREGYEYEYDESNNLVVNRDDMPEIGPLLHSKYIDYDVV